MNLARAVSPGHSQPAWFPDWSDRPCAIIATGPSAKREAAIPGLRGSFGVIAIKEAAVDLAPWADVAYGCDAAWWIHRRGLPNFRGVKVAWAPRVGTEYPDVHLIRIAESGRSRPHDREYIHRILVDRPGVIGSGHSSGFQALNLAVQFGARRVALIGFNLSGSHYYGRNNWPKAGNPDDAQFARCRGAYEGASPFLKSIGVDVVNTTTGSALGCFRHVPLPQIINDWC